MKVTKEWLDLTDALIELAEQKNVHTLNGELLVAKLPPAKKSKGGIHLPGTTSNRDSYLNGFARILKLPSTPFTSTAGQIEPPSIMKAGDMIYFPHGARTKPQPHALNILFGEEVESEEEHEKHMSDYTGDHHDFGMLFMVSFTDVQVIRDGEALRAELLDRDA